MKRPTTKKAKSAKPREFILYIFLVAALRRAYRKTPAYRDALSGAKEEFFIPSKSGTMMRRVHFKCAECGRFFVNKKGSKEVAVDHVSPVISPDTGFVDYNTLIDRMFNGKVQVLCNYKGERDGKRSCHYVKTQKERAILAETKKRLQTEGKNVTRRER